MLKGILFIVFIIITFDIGVSIIEYFDEESAVEAVDADSGKGSSAVDEKQPEQMELQSEKGEGAKSHLDLSLPADVEFDEDNTSEYEGGDSAPSESIEKRQIDLEQKQKPSGLRAKPIIGLDDGFDKPQVEGATIEWKREL